MSVDSAAMHSLQIFSTDRHPSLLGKGKAKEGLSLFGISDHTKSPAGRRLLKYVFSMLLSILSYYREWFLRPSTQASVIESRLDGVSFFVEPSLASAVKELQSFLKGIRDLSTIVVRIRYLI